MRLTRKSAVMLVVRVVLLTILMSVSQVANAMGAGPVKFVPTTQFGYKVNKTTGQNVCSLRSVDECQPAEPSMKALGFNLPEGVAVGPSGDIYVSDLRNNRVQEFTPTGEFILMFGAEVNETKDNTPGATESEKSLCTAEEINTLAVKCTKGTSGATSVSFDDPLSIAVDPSTGNIYVQDLANNRVDEYTSVGKFLLMIGKEVNLTKSDMGGATESEENICTAASGNVCQAGVRSTIESHEKGGFDFERAGNILVIGDTPEHLLYVGDSHRIQVFDSSGEWKSEMRLPASLIASSPTNGISGVAIDATGEYAYLVFNRENVVRRFNLGTGVEEGSPITVAQRQANHAVSINDITIESSGDLAVYVQESGTSESSQFGLVFEAATGMQLNTFEAPDAHGSHSFTTLAFDASGNLYITISEENELVRIEPLPVAELITGMATCKTGAKRASSVSFDCSLSGKVNPYNVANTEARFEWGLTCSAPEFTTQLDKLTTEEAFVPVSAEVEGLRPNEAFCFLLAATDQNVRAPEKLVGQTVSFQTPAVPPNIVGSPSVSFVTFDSAVMYAELNPENTSTEYFFEYAPVKKPGEDSLASCPGIEKANCPGVLSTPILKSSAYGSVGLTLEASALRAGTTYDYRLAAGNIEGEDLLGPNSIFTTAAAPTVEADTLPVGPVTSSGAIISGTINPDGQQASYAFELGIYEGGNTHFSPVASGITGAGTTPEVESATLNNLQPSTVYAYRISVSSGYGVAYGQPTTFATLPVAAAELIAPVPLLEVPNIKFPVMLAACKHGYERDKKGACMKIKAKKTKKIKTRRKAKKPNRR